MMSARTDKTVNFKLSAPPEQLDKMTEELENAPTYRITLEEHDLERELVAVNQVHNRDQEVTTATAVSSPSLNQKLAGYSSVKGYNSDDRYERVSILGEGGTGIVYEMTDHNVERNVAVKILKESKDTSERQAFIEEGKLAAKLEHPNIIPVYDMDVDTAGQVFLTMKNVQGSHMKAYIDGDLDVDMEEIILIFSKVCDALEYAHSLGQTHQDIKPENIMVGDYGEVFLIDWGSAVAKDGEMQISPVYMSPEQARGELPAVTDDVYCLGASLFHVLTKRFPTNAKTINELWEKKTKGLVDMPTVKENRNLPVPLLAIALKAMKADTSARYQTVEALSDDLKAYMSGYATTAENAGPLTLFELFIKRHFREATILLVSCVMLSVFGGFYYVHIHKTQVALVEAELQAFQLAEERKEHWVPILQADFSNPKGLDQRLSIGPEDITDGGVYLRYKSPISMIKVNEPVEAEPRLEVVFQGKGLPSLRLGFSCEDPRDDRYLNIRKQVHIYTYYNGFQTLYSSSKLCEDALIENGTNNIQCWRRNNTWYVTINGINYIEYYDPDLSVGIHKTTLSISRHIIFDELKITAINVWNRHAPDYTSVLEQGRLLHQMGELEKAREWFHVNAAHRQNKTMMHEAAFLAASIDAGQGLEVQMQDLGQIASDPDNPFRFNAMHHQALRAAEAEDWQRTFEYMLAVSEHAPELNTFNSLWGKIKPYMRQLPEKEKYECLQDVARSPLSVLDLSRLQVADFSMIFRESPARELSIADNPVRDLNPLRTLNIKNLDISKTHVVDLTPLTGMELDQLNLSDLEVSDLKPLSGMSLDFLIAKRSPNLDLSTLAGVTVKKLVLDDSPLKKPEFLTTTDAKLIRVQNCGLTDLDFLKGMTPVELIARRNAISDIRGIENLEFSQLYLGHNEITDAKPLATCKINDILELGNNPLSDISHLKNQPLKELRISFTKIEDLSVLESMRNLTTLTIKGSGDPDFLPPATYTPVPPDLSTIGALNLKKLDMTGAGVDDISPLRQCTLSNNLNLSSNPISDISHLTGQPLKTLSLNFTKVTDLSVLQTMEHLENLAFAKTPKDPSGGVEAISSLAKLPLKYINLSGHPLTDISPLQGCRSLTSLDLTDCPISDIRPLKNLPLRSLNLGGTNVTNLTAIRSLHDLEHLGLGHDPEHPGQLTDLSPLIGLEIKNLILSYQSVKDLSPLKSCKIEGILALDGNPIRDISALEGQPIWALDLSYTQVKDLAVLKSMKHLMRLTIVGVELDDENKALLDKLSLRNLITEEPEDD